LLLPKLMIPVAIDIFITNFDYYLDEFLSREDSPKLTFSKNNISYSGCRYSVYIEEEKPETSQQFLIGEIDVIKVHNNRTDIRAAVYRIQDYKEGLNFFDKFYFMIFAKWEIEFNVELLNCKRGEGATMEWVKIGWYTGYFCLPDVYSEMFCENDCYDDFLQYSPNDLEMYDYFSESVLEDIRQEYEHKINLVLPEFSQANDEISDNLEGTNERIIEIVEQIPDHNNDRKILRMWLENESVQDISDEIDRTPRTVYNTISKLRSDPKIGHLVPLDKDRPKKKNYW